MTVPDEVAEDAVDTGDESAAHEDGEPLFSEGDGLYTGADLRMVHGTGSVDVTVDIKHVKLTVPVSAGEVYAMLSPETAEAVGRSLLAAADRARQEDSDDE